MKNGCECKVQPNQDMHRNQKRNHLITPCIDSKKITTNLTDPYFTSAKFWVCYFSPVSGFNDEKIKVQVLQ